MKTVYLQIENNWHPYIKDSKVEICSGGGGSIDIQLRKVVGGEGGEGRGVDPHPTQEGSAKSFQGLPLTVDLGGGVD